MAVRGTRKPCPGCGNTTWREVDKVCGRCRNLLDAAIKAEEKIKNDVETGYYLVKPIQYERRQRWEDQFWRLVHKLADVTVNSWAPASTRLIDPSHIDSHGWQSQSVVVGLSHQVAEALRTLWIYMRAECDHQYQIGVGHGSNLLRRLANGDISVLHFEEQVKR